MRFYPSNSKKGLSITSSTHSILDSIPDQIALLDTGGRIVYVNEAWRKAETQYSHQVTLGSNYFEVCKRSSANGNEDSQHVLQGILSVIEKQVPFFSYVYPCHSVSKQRWFTIKVSRTNDSQPLIVVVHENITDRVLAQNKANQLIEEKQALLREVDHRFKNNLASLNGVLKLQLQAVNNTDAAQVIKDAIARTQTIQILHAKLTQSADHKIVDGKDYLESLCFAINELYNNGSKIAFHISVDEFSMDAKRMAIIGYIVNELLTNSFKHAFTNSCGGIIEFKARTNIPKLVLSINDNGKGFVEHFNFSQKNGVGISMVRMLSENLGMEIRFANADGAVITMELDI